jgi:hypothetical protein
MYYVIGGDGDTGNPLHAATLLETIFSVEFLVISSTIRNRFPGFPTERPKTYLAVSLCTSEKIIANFAHTHTLNTYHTRRTSSKQPRDEWSTR